MGDDGRGAVTATGLLCGSCGTELPPNSKFCNECGAPVRPAATAAQYKSVTALFRDKSLANYCLPVAAKVVCVRCEAPTRRLPTVIRRSR